MEKKSESGIHLENMEPKQFKSILSGYNEDEILLVFNYNENDANEVDGAEYALTIPIKEYALFLKLLVGIGKKYEEETGRQIGIGKRNDKAKD